MTAKPDLEPMDYGLWGRSVVTVNGQRVALMYRPENKAEALNLMEALSDR